jgi:hypothetical protein
MPGPSKNEAPGTAGVRRLRAHAGQFPLVGLLAVLGEGVGALWWSVTGLVERGRLVERALPGQCG